MQVKLKGQTRIFKTIEKDIALENYEHNKDNFFSRINFDVIHQMMANLDHLSNINLIRSSKHLYEKYTSQALDGNISYSDCLFTKFPFPFESHTRAMFNYAAHNKRQAEMLLHIEDVDGSRSALLKKFSIKASDQNAIMNFYQQKFSSEQMCRMLRDCNFLQIMLKRGVSINAKDEDGGFTFLMYALHHENAVELLNILLQNLRIDLNQKTNSGFTVGDLVSNEPDTLELLLNNVRTEISMSSILCWVRGIGLYRKNPEIAKLLFQKTSFSTKIKFPVMVITGSLFVSLLLTKIFR